MWEGFSVSSDVVGECRVVSASGELDELTARVLEEELAGSDDLLPVVVDLSGLEFIASAGIHVLMRGRPAGRLAVVCPRGNVARVLGIVRAGDAVTLFEDLGSAVRASARREMERGYGPCESGKEWIGASRAATAGA